MNINWICHENQATRVTEEGRFLPKCFCRKASEALLMRSMATPESISPFNVSLFPIILPVTKVKSAKFWCTEPLKEKDIYNSCCLKKIFLQKYKMILAQLDNSLQNKETECGIWSFSRYMRVKRCHLRILNYNSSSC